MAYWLIKSEPSAYSWQQFLKEKQTVWSGIRNYTARNNLRKMQKGDLCFFYHSNIGLEIVGIAEVVKPSFQDITSPDSNWLAVEVKPKKTLSIPISLHQIKQTALLQDMELVKISRLSVSSIKDHEWDIVMQLANTSL